MSFGKRLLKARKSKGLSQEDIAKTLETKAPVIGRYERDEMNPSIDVATKLSRALDVSLDWLVGNTNIEVDTAMLDRVIELQNLPADIQDKLFYFIDMTIRDFKAKQAYSA